jgi:long-chain fatty acid transport protein
VQPLIIDAEFDSKAGTTAPGGGGDGGNAGGVLPSLGGYYVHRLTERVRLGFSMTSYFGLGLDYDHDWVGRYYIQEGDFITLFAGPSAAYRLNDWLSIGGSVGAVYGLFKARTALPNIEPSAGDGRLKYKDGAFGVAGSVGLLFEPWKSARFGLTYYSPVDLDFEDHPDLKGVGPGLQAILDASGGAGRTLGLDFTLPQWVMVSAVYEPIGKLALMANANWQDWSEFGYIDVNIESLTDRTINAHYKDTFQVAVGGSYRVATPWLLMAGFAYDSSPASTSSRSVALPLDQQLRYALGVQYSWTKDLTLGLAYEFIDAGSADINQSRPLAGTLVGDYSPNHIQVVNVNLIWRF